jgi:hypothetical protein
MNNEHYKYRGSSAAVALNTTVDAKVKIFEEQAAGGCNTVFVRLDGAHCSQPAPVLQLNGIRLEAARKTHKDTLTTLFGHGMAQPINTQTISYWNEVH